LAGLARIYANTAASGRLDPGPNPRRIDAQELCSDLLETAVGAEKYKIKLI
jgi:hypothetical protein